MKKIVLLGWAASLCGGLVAAWAAVSFAAHATNTNPRSADYGAAPELSGISHWINSAPLSMHSLRGKVVLVDFWTASCINCIHTLPHVTAWYERYRADGLVVVGVHTPEYPEESATGTVETAVRRYGIHYPVAQDNGYETWKAFGNQFWPASYLVDRNGKIVFRHYGEGDYDDLEDAIKKQLAEKG